MSSSQSCVRCQKHKRKCDLKMPSCGLCSQADVECFMVDPGSKRLIPRSYLQSLQQRVADLEAQINQHAGSRDYHDSTVYAFLGRGTSARMLQEISALRILHAAPRQQNLDDTSPSAVSPDIDHDPIESLQVDLTGDHLHRLLTPKIQRDLIQHFFNHIQPHLPPLFSDEEEAHYRDFDRYSSVWSLLCSEWQRCTILLLCAVSAHAISQHGRREFAFIAQACAAKINSIIQSSGTQETSFELVTVFCLYVLREYIDSRSASIWMFVGNAGRMLLGLAAGPDVTGVKRFQAVRRLGLFLSFFECNICNHFKRPSTLLRSLRRLSNEAPTALDVAYDINQETQGLTLSTETHLLSIIPDAFRLDQGMDQCTFPNALLYITLHPLFTADLAWIEMDTLPCPCSSSLFDTICRAAKIILDTTSRQLHTSEIIGLAFRAEQVLQSGLIIVVYTILQSRAGEDGWKSTALFPKTDVLHMLSQCSTILLCLSERWNPGIAMYLAWEGLHRSILPCMT